MFFGLHKYTFAASNLSNHITRMKHSQLGIANRNPLNLRFNAKNFWKGTDAKNPVESEIWRFRNAAYCYRASIIQLCKFIEHHGANTPRKIIALWLPGHGGIKERHYLPCVCGRSRLDPDEVISPHGMQIPRLLAAMARQETGTHIVPESIYEIRLKFGV